MKRRNSDREISRKFKKCRKEGKYRQNKIEERGTDKVKRKKGYTEGERSVRK